MFMRIAVVLALIGSFTATVAAPALSQATEDCQGALEQLRADTAAAGSSFANEKDLARALVKLDDAASKLAEGKTADASAKVADFQGSVRALANAPKPKLDPVAAERLATGAQGVIDCLSA